MSVRMNALSSSKIMKDRLSVCPSIVRLSVRLRLFVCMSGLFVCMSVLSVCPSIRMNAEFSETINVRPYVRCDLGNYKSHVRMNAEMSV